VPKRFKKRFSRSFQFLLQTLGAITVTASPRFGPILVAALPAIVRVLDARQLKELLPILALFLQRSRAIADLDPSRRFVGTKPGLLHISQVLALGNRTLPEGSVFDRF
jgi:hypothetical protein